MKIWRKTITESINELIYEGVRWSLEVIRWSREGVRWSCGDNFDVKTPTVKKSCFGTISAFFGAKKLQNVKKKCIVMNVEKKNNR